MAWRWSLRSFLRLNLAPGLPIQNTLSHGHFSALATPCSLVHDGDSNLEVEIDTVTIVRKVQRLRRPVSSLSIQYSISFYLFAASVFSFCCANVMFKHVLNGSSPILFILLKPLLNPEFHWLHQITTILSEFHWRFRIFFGRNCQS